jgi:hypothetical protein
MIKGARYVLILKRDRGGKWFFQAGGAGPDKAKWYPLSAPDAKEIPEMLAKEGGAEIVAKVRGES